MLSYKVILNLKGVGDLDVCAYVHKNDYEFILLTKIKARVFWFSCLLNFCKHTDRQTTTKETS